MTRRCFLLFFVVITIPLLLGVTAWQSVRYSELEKETRLLEADQEERVENNRRIIADIAAMTSSGKVEDVAVNDLGLVKIQPENVLQIWIDRR